VGCDRGLTTVAARRRPGQTGAVNGGPETRYARTPDGDHVAYQVLGRGPVDLLCAGYGNVISIDQHDEEPHVRRFEQRLASFSRLIRFDRRGVGLSDRITDGDVGASVVDDIVAVLDATGTSRASLFAVGGSGLSALRAAARHPDRVRSLVLVNSYARLPWADDYEFGTPWELLDRFIEGVTDVSNEDPVPDVDDVRILAPSLGRDNAFRDWWSRAGRQGASPATARILLKAAFQGDVRDQLQVINAPTLIVHRNPSLFVVEHARYLAAHISDARLVELPGGDHLPFGEGSDAIVDEIEEFLTGSRGGAATERILTTVLFTDIVGSTERATREGDRSWHKLLDSHDAMVRSELHRFGGREVKTTGDGILATFASPTQAIRCASSICAGATRMEMEVRAGLHTGEVEARGDDVSGIAVHLAQRISGQAGAGEVLVSRTVVDLVAGSGTAFSERGQHELKGLDGSWLLFAVAERPPT